MCQRNLLSCDWSIWNGGHRPTETKQWTLMEMNEWPYEYSHNNSTKQRWQTNKKQIYSLKNRQPSHLIVCSLSTLFWNVHFKVKYANNRWEKNKSFITYSALFWQTNSSLSLVQLIPFWMVQEPVKQYRQQRGWDYILTTKTSNTIN